MNKILIKMGVVITLGALMVSTPLFAISSGGIGGRPANPVQDNPRTNSIFIYDLAGGKTKKDQILVKNSSDEKATIKIYAVDGIVTQTGDLTCRQEVEPREGLSDWIKVDRSEIALDANTEELVDFIVSVPENADVGEHNACIVVQRKDEKSKAEATGGVQLQTRQAVRMAVIVPGDIRREVTIDKFEINREGRLQKYVIGIKNVGNVSADVDIKLKIRNSSGNVVYENGGEYAAVANEVRTFTYESALRPLFGGKYTVDLEISYDKRAGSWGTADASQLITKKADQKEMMFLPSSTVWMALAGVVLALALFFAARHRSRRKGIGFNKTKRR